MRKTLVGIVVGAALLLFVLGIGRAFVYGVGVLMDVKVQLDAEDREYAQMLDVLRADLEQAESEKTEAEENGAKLYRQYEDAKKRYFAAEAAAAKARHKLQRAERAAERMEAEAQAREAAEREEQREISYAEKMTHIALKGLCWGIVAFLALILYIQIRAWQQRLPFVQIWGPLWM